MVANADWAGPTREKGGGREKGQRGPASVELGCLGRKEGGEGEKRKRSFSFSNLIFQIQFQMVFEFL
jgi:hypothetical protein